ncbi:MAG TPA: hypothetical protein VGA99_13350 [bacterium]
MLIFTTDWRQKPQRGKAARLPDGQATKDATDFLSAAFGRNQK